MALCAVLYSALHHSCSETGLVFFFVNYYFTLESHSLFCMINCSFVAGEIINASWCFSGFLPRFFSGCSSVWTVWEPSLKTARVDFFIFNVFWSRAVFIVSNTFLRRANKWKYQRRENWLKSCTIYRWGDSSAAHFQQMRNCCVQVACIICLIKKTWWKYDYIIV